MNQLRLSLQLLLMLCISISLSACIKPYQPDIQQGNIINNSDLREIRYGMSKQEVLFILGTPLITDPFNTERWDYYFSNLDQRKNEVSTRLITAIFDGNTLVKLEGDVDLSKVQNLEPSTEDMQHGGTVITRPTQKEKGFLTRAFSKDKVKKTSKKEDE